MPGTAHVLKCMHEMLHVDTGGHDDDLGNLNIRIMRVRACLHANEVIAARHLRRCASC